VTEIQTAVQRLPVPHKVKTFLLFRDKDYSDDKQAWQQLQHLLPSDQEQQHRRAFPGTLL
jgi:hypothetical protein